MNQSLSPIPQHVLLTTLVPIYRRSVFSSQSSGQISLVLYVGFVVRSIHHGTGQDPASSSEPIYLFLFPVY